MLRMELWLRKEGVENESPSLRWQALTARTEQLGKFFSQRGVYWDEVVIRYQTN